jgi:peptidoglycan biosynthesis protein MviN/MurJ (putative lipid II flippase)
VRQTISRRQREGNKFSLPVLAILWIAFFSYTTSVALLFQYLVLPMVPSLHAGQGLLSQDSLYFHRVAQTLAEAIARDGWSAWTAWPTASAHGNVAVLAALYAIFGPNPSSAIPINACLHASSGVLLILIARDLFSARAVHWGAVVAACLFIGFPSALNWYGQIHKDGYAILGFLLLLYSGVKILRLETVQGAAFSLLLAGAGLALTAFVRPNNLQLFQIMAVGMLVLAVALFRRMNTRCVVQILFSVMIVLAATIIRPPVGQLDESVKLRYSEQGSGGLADWHWTSSSVVPRFVDDFAKKLSNLRVFMAAHGVRENAGSMIDLDSMPGNTLALLGYLPRAAMVGVFAPFPDTWGSKFSLARMVGVAETFLWYAIFPGLLWSIWRRRRDPVLWWLLGCALAILTVESYVTANLGTLHRVRYPFLFILILLGTIGWAEAIRKYCWKSGETPMVPPLPEQPDCDAEVLEVSVPGTGAMAAAKRGLLVVVLTGCLFIGLFARDILLVRVLGLGADLDSYQLASFIPLFVTALLAVPLGPVLITQFLSIRQGGGREAAASWVGSMAGASMGVFAVLSFAVAGVVWFGFLGTVSEGVHTSVGRLLLWLLPVVALSGSVVLGNAVLMANSRAVSATLAQLAVPLISVMLILILGSEIGAVAAAAGLMLGQLINYLLVARASNSLGYSIRPRFGNTRWREWGGQYAPLVAASALTSAAIPVGVYFASRLPEGSVAAFSMGAKVLQSITALISAALIAVVLPYFSRLFATNRLIEVRRSLQLLLSLGTALAVPFAFVLFVSADQIAAVLFAGGRIGATEIKHLASVIQYGALQFPFYVVLVVLIKFTIAGRETLWVLIAALLGQLANIVGALLLVGRFGTAGLAMSMTLGIAVSSLLLLLWATIRQHMSWMSSALVAISWMLFFTLAVCVHYGSVPGSIVCVLAFLALMLGELGLSSRGPREPLAV